MKNKNNLLNASTLGVFAVLLICSFSFYAGAQDAGGNNIFQDFDGDGLSNGEEKSLGTDPHEADTDKDGYSDGTEIESGYDPLIPAPGDRIVKEKKGEDAEEGKGGLESGLTDSLTEMLKEYAQTSISDGDETIDQEDLDEQIEEFFDDEVDLIDLSENDQERIHIKSQEYPDLSEIEKEQKIKDDAVEYYAALGYIFRETAPEIYDAGSFDSVLDQTFAQSQVVGTDPQSIEYFTSITDQMLGGSDHLYEIAVPETLLEFHIKVLQISDYAKTAFDLQADPESILDDPLGFYHNISRATSMLALIEEVQDEWANSMEELGVSSVDLVEVLELN